MSGHRRSGLRRRLEVTLVAVALVSVVLLSAINYVFARVLISDGVEAQLSVVRDTRVEAIERGAARLEAESATLAATPSVRAALEALSAGYAELDGDLTASQSTAVESAYEAAFEALRATGGDDVPAGSAVPASDAGRLVQYHYIGNNPEPFGSRDLLDDAGDGSSYSAAHAEYHPLLRSLAQNFGVADLMLVDAASREVVYSVEKHIDLGTNVLTGPWAQSALAGIFDALNRTAIGNPVITETTFYTPARSEALIFLATAIRSGSKVTGAVVTTLPVTAITNLVTAGQDWDLLGLGRTGDTYLVGPDGTMRTDPRAWLDDPDGFLSDYLDRTGDESAVERMRRVGSPALTQAVDNRAVEDALAGESFVGSVTSYDGASAFAASGPINVGSQNWVVIVEQERSEANDGLGALLRSMLVVMAVLVPVTALLGLWLARSLTRPFGDLVDAARRIADGERSPDVTRLGNNELGDVGRQLEMVAGRLAAEEASISAEEAQVNEVLGAVLPPRLIERVRRGETQIVDLLDTATVMSFLVDGIPEAAGSDYDTVSELHDDLVAGVDRLVDEFRIERVRRSPSNALFVAGLGEDDARAAEAVRFTAAMIQMVVEVGEEYDQPLTVRAGIASGDVASGVIGEQQFSFSVWGEPVSAAFSLASLAQPGEVLVDAEVHNALESATAQVDGEWEFVRRDALAGLDDDLEAWSIGRPATAAS